MQWRWHGRNANATSPPSWMVLFISLIGIPAAISFFHYKDWLVVSQCTIWRIDSTVSVSCPSPRHFGSQVYTTFESTSAPSVVELSTWLFAASKSRQSHPPTTSNSDISEGILVWDGAAWRTTSDSTYKPKNVVSVRATDMEKNSVDKSNNLAQSSSGKNVYGFRQNPNKSWFSQNDARIGGKRSETIPIATPLLLILNIGLFFYFWNGRVDPSRVALNEQVFHDFGRAITGNLSHFEIWHIGFNMMTLTSLGVSLEHNIYGSIPALLYTIAFLPLTTIVVICVHGFHKRFQRVFGSTNQHNHDTSTFPSMVGFSGILFAWMVVSTLEGNKSCPIFFLPNICFDTYTVPILGGIHMSLGPLVQLVVLQFILPRVSFLGHLAGIIVGFLWHWNLLPPLSLLQPAISFPTLWLIGKLLLWSGAVTHISTDSSVYHGQRTLGCDLTSTVRRLIIIRTFLIVHMISLAYILGLFNVLVLSQALLLVMLSLVAHSESHKELGKKFGFGAVGMGLVGTVIILLLTDGLTLGGWCATWPIWPSMEIATILLLTRDILFAFSTCLICYGLRYSNESSTFPDGTNGGAAKLILGPFVEICDPCGKWLANWNLAPGTSNHLDSVALLRRQQPEEHVIELSADPITSSVV